MNEKNILATRINQMRKELNLTQEGLALKLGLKGKSSIANYESGKITPSDDIKLKMCELFNCTMDYLMGKSNFRTNEEELTNYLNIEIKDDLIKNLKALELDKSDLEKAVTAFVENYMVPTNEFSVKIYDMEDSLIYFAYELITKYYFKLINKKLSALTNNSVLLVDKQAYFEKAEEYAWNKMKKILEDIDENTIISNLTSEERAHKFISNLETNSKYYMCPVYNQFDPKENPNWETDSIQSRIPLDVKMFNISDYENCFFIKINYDSMSYVVKNGQYALIQKQSTYNENDIILIAGPMFGKVILRKCIQIKDNIVLLSTECDGAELSMIDINVNPLTVIGKFIGKIEINQQNT